MGLSDPIAEMLSRIRKAQGVGKASVVMPSSKLKIAIAQVLKDGGSIDSFRVTSAVGKSELEICLKHGPSKPMIGPVEREGRTGLYVYRADQQVARTQKGRGATSVEAPKGVSRSRRALPSRTFSTGRPASKSTKLSFQTLNALSRALGKV
jgi:small subunit ribosomal protein S8